MREKAISEKKRIGPAVSYRDHLLKKERAEKLAIRRRGLSSDHEALELKRLDLKYRELRAKIPKGAV